MQVQQVVRLRTRFLRRPAPVETRGLLRRVEGMLENARVEFQEDSCSGRRARSTLLSRFGLSRSQRTRWLNLAVGSGPCRDAGPHGP